MSIWNDLSWVEGIRTPFFNYFFYNVSLTGYPIFLFLFIAFGYFFWSPQRFSRVAMLLFISAVINSFLKDLFQDPRPPSDFMLDEELELVMLAQRTCSNCCNTLGAFGV